MTDSIEKLKEYVTSQTGSGNLDGKNKKDHDKALEYAWGSVDYATYRLWPDAIKCACLAVKTELNYDPKATKWRALPKRILELMEDNLW